MSNPDPSWQVLCNDARDLSPIPDASVHAIITSVPYHGLRRYVDDDREIGREETLQTWLDNLVDCAREWRRVLRDDGTLWVNCGDAYANNTKWGGKSGNKNRSSNNGGYEGQRVKRNSDFKPKDLMCLPHRLSRALQDGGWYLRSAIVWVKGIDWTDAEREAQEQIRDALALVREQAAGSLWGLSKDLARALNKAERAVDRLAMSGAVMPESVRDRCTSSYEMLFMFAKGQWKTGIIELSNLPGEYVHLSYNLRFKPPRLGASQIGIFLATSILDFAQSEYNLSLPLFNAEIGKESLDNLAGHAIRSDPVMYRATILSARFINSHMTSKEFLSQLYSLGITLTETDKLLIGRRIPLLLPPSIYSDGKTSIAVHHASEICKFDFVHGHIIIQSPIGCNYYYDREAIRVPRSGNTHPRGEGITPKGKAADHIKIRANSSFHAATSGHIVASRNARNVWRIATEPSPSGGYALPDGRTISHFASYPRALAARAILAATSEAGCCAQCGAPFERSTRPSPQYAQFLGNDWADYEQDAAEGRGHSISPQRPTKRGRAVSAEYITVAHVPTCLCYGEPVGADVPCPACNGTGTEHAYLRGSEPYKAHTLPGRHPSSINTDHDGKDFARPQPTGHPCPACLCPDCGGSGREHKTHVGQTESSYNEGMTANRLALLRQAAREAGSEYNGSFCGLETGEPCSTCNGLGATGHANGETWPDDVLETWPRQPCTVLDPMAGTGQTGMAALDLGRSVILNDLSPDYCDLMRARLDAWPADLRGPAKASSTDDDESLKPLPLMEVKQCQSDDPA